MKLYKILFKPVEPLYSEQGVLCLLLAENDTQVFDWIKLGRKIGKHNVINNHWSENENVKINNSDGTDTETLKEKIIRLKGDLLFDSKSYVNNFYFWELVSDDININLIDESLFEQNVIFSFVSRNYYKIGDNITIINSDHQYSSYVSMFEKLSFKNHYFNYSYNGQDGTIFDIAIHEDTGETMYAINLDNGTQCLISSEGINLK